MPIPVNETGYKEKEGNLPDFFYPNPSFMCISKSTNFSGTVV